MSARDPLPAAAVGDSRYATTWPAARGASSAWRRRLQLDSGFVAMSLLTLLVAFLVLFPLGMLIYGSFWTSRPGFPGALTLDNYVKAYTVLETYRILITTVLLIAPQTLGAGTFPSTRACIVTRTHTTHRDP